MLLLNVADAAFICAAHVFMDAVMNAVDTVAHCFSCCLLTMSKHMKHDDRPLHTRVLPNLPLGQDSLHQFESQPSLN